MVRDFITANTDAIQTPSQFTPFCANGFSEAKYGLDRCLYVHQLLNDLFAFVKAHCYRVQMNGETILKPAKQTSTAFLQYLCIDMLMFVF